MVIVQQLDAFNFFRVSVDRKAEENHRRRSAVVDLGGSGDRKREAEVGIKIHVANFT